MNEKRKYIRLRAPIGIVYRETGKMKKESTTASYVKNISGGGLSFIVKDEFKAGDLLELDVQIPHAAEPIRTTGEVVWYSVARERERQVREAGIRFKGMAAQDLERIVEYVRTAETG